MPTRFTSLGVAGTLTVAGLTTLASVVITTLTLTTANITTANVQTLSGTTAVYTDPNDIVRARTLSGTVTRGATLSGETINIRSTAKSNVICKLSGATLGVCSSVVNAVGDCACTAF